MLDADGHRRRGERIREGASGKAAMARRSKTIRDKVIAKGVAGLLWLGFRLPYATRIRFLGWIGGSLVAPMVGYRARIRRNLALVCPELPAGEVRRIAR